MIEQLLPNLIRAECRPMLEILQRYFDRSGPSDEAGPAVRPAAAALPGTRAADSHGRMDLLNDYRTHG